MGDNMEEKQTLTINGEELKGILAKHYFSVDFQTNENCYHTTSLEIKFENQQVDHRKIQFVLNYDKKTDSFNKPIKRQYVITKDEVIGVINKKLSKYGYKIDDFDCNLTYGRHNNEKDVLNFVVLNLRKKGLIKTKKRGWKKHV